MAATFSELSLTFPDNFLSASAKWTVPWGASTKSYTEALPPIAKADLSLWSGSGSQLGKFNILALAGSTLTSVTPGTTDTYNLDLQALTDIANESKSAAEVCELIIFNFATADASTLVLQPHGTNGWTAPWADMGTPADGKLRVPPGFTHPTRGGTVPGHVSLFGGNLAAFAVSGSNKVLKLTTAAATLEWRAVIAGRTAAS